MKIIMSKTLRDYQEKLINEVLSIDNNRISVLAPTGAGKSIIIKTLVDKFGKDNTLVVVPSIILRNQFKEKWGVNSVVINSFFKNEVWKDYNYIIADECHQWLVKMFRLLPQDKKLIGFTATPITASANFTGVYNVEVYGPSFNELVNKGYLTNMVEVDSTEISKHIITSIEMKSHREGSKEDGDDALEVSVNVNPGGLKYLVDKLEEEGKTTIIFLSTNKIVREISKYLDRPYVTTDSSSEKVNLVKEGLRNGSIKTVVNNRVLLTGFDEPNIDCIIWLKKTSSFSTYTQGIGRGSRVKEGKTHCEIYDLTQNYLMFTESFDELLGPNYWEIVKNLRRMIPRQLNCGCTWLKSTNVCPTPTLSDCSKCPYSMTKEERETKEKITKEKQERIERLTLLSRWRNLYDKELEIYESCNSLLYNKFPINDYLLRLKEVLGGKLGSKWKSTDKHIDVIKYEREIAYLTLWRDLNIEGVNSLDSLCKYTLSLDVDRDGWLKDYINNIIKEILLVKGLAPVENLYKVYLCLVKLKKEKILIDLLPRLSKKPNLLEVFKELINKSYISFVKNTEVVQYIPSLKRLGTLSGNNLLNRLKQVTLKELEFNNFTERLNNDPKVIIRNYIEE